jgi:hypothetical protein
MAVYVRLPQCRERAEGVSPCFLQCMSPELARFGRVDRFRRRPVIGVKRTYSPPQRNDATDPEPTLPQRSRTRVEIGRRTGGKFRSRLTLFAVIRVAGEVEKGHILYFHMLNDG